MTSTPPGIAALQSNFQDFVARYHEALKHQSHGDSAPLLSLWSTDDDVVFMAPMGGYQLGFKEVSGLLAAVAKVQSYEDWHAENLLTKVDDHTALTVEVEHISRKPDPSRKSEWPDAISLRVTTFFRREDGEWRLVVRHANFYEELNFPPYTSSTAQ
jgi:ketosteroid isomerase-like protein